MHFLKDRCSHCRAPMYRDPADPWGFNATEPSYWFCSASCLEKEIDTRVDKESGLNFKYYDSAGCKNLLERSEEYHTQDDLERFKRMADEGRAEFVRRKESNRSIAKRKLDWELHEEARHHYLQDWRKEQEARDKDFEAKYQKAMRLAEKYEEKVEKDHEHALTEHEEFLAMERSRDAISEGIPLDARFEHTHILGPAGSGKTTLLESIIVDDLKYLIDSPAYVVIDPKGLMIDRLSRLDMFNPETGRLKDRLIIIDPTKEPLPALNMFKLPIDAATPAERNRIRNQLIETFAYIFSSAGSEITQRQSIPFAFIIRLIFFMNGDINTLMDLLEDDHNKRAFQPEIDRLSAVDSAAKRFFERDFYDTAFRDTKQQIKTRVYEIVSRPELMDMFSASDNKVSFFDCLQNSKIVLVNTAMGQLGEKSSTLLGRYIIAMTLNAAFSRFTLPKTAWTPAFLVIDEFQDYADQEATPRLLRLAREYNLGVHIAHQTMHAKELNDSLRTSISTNTSVKYAASPEGIDLSYMARDLRATSDFLTEQTKTPTHARFACYVRGVTERPVSLSIPLGGIGREPQMDDAAHAALIARNRARLSAPPPVPMPLPTAPESARSAPPPAAEPARPTAAPAKSTPETPPTYREPSGLAVGDLVQWTSGGAQQFDAPKRIVGFSADGRYAFIEDSNTGLPVAELSVIEAGTRSAKARVSGPPPGRSHPDHGDAGEPSKDW